jgi:uncharacterized membrane protein YeaQ/YmgE (transglycosylase-associated protein family)
MFNMSILTWVAFGLIAGVIANIIDPNPARGGITGAVILGILGAVLGGFISSIIFGVAINGFNLTSLAVATLGAFLLLFLQRLFISRE